MCCPSPRRPSHVGTEGSEHAARPLLDWLLFLPFHGAQPGPGWGWGDRTCRAGARGHNFSVFYPFATWSPIERNGSLRANRSGWPGSGPLARPQESCPLWRGEGKSSRNQWRNRRGRGSCQQTQLHHVTHQQHGNTPTHTAAQRARPGRVVGSRGPPSCPLRGGLGGRVNA